MTLLNFDKPAKVKINDGFDGGPDGGYVPQMSNEDAERWKAKKFNMGKPNARIELRKSFPRGSQVMIIVAEDGWDFSSKNEVIQNETNKGGYFTETKGLQVRMSMNGPLLMKLKEFDEINQIVHEAMEYIKNERNI